MVLDFLNPAEESSIEDLIKEGEIIGGLDENRNWIQDKVVMLGRNHGLQSYRQEFRTHNVDLETGEGEPSSFDQEFLKEGTDKIKKSLEGNFPVIVSVYAKKNDDGSIDGLGDSGTAHTIVLNGFEENDNGEMESFLLLNPAGKDKNNFEERVSVNDFKKFWRKFAIFFE